MDALRILRANSTGANDCFCSRDWKLNSTLADRTIESRALSLPDLFDGRAAHAAGFACASVREIALLEITAAAVAVHEVAQCAAALFDGFLQYFPDVLRQLFTTWQ
jgi:hypothetical protein